MLVISTIMKTTNPLIQQLEKYGPLSSLAKKDIEGKIKIFLKKKKRPFFKRRAIVNELFRGKERRFQSLYS